MRCIKLFRGRRLTSQGAVDFHSEVPKSSFGQSSTRTLRGWPSREALITTQKGRMLSGRPFCDFVSFCFF